MAKQNQVQIVFLKKFAWKQQLKLIAFVIKWFFIAVLIYAVFVYGVKSTVDYIFVSVNATANNIMNKIMKKISSFLNSMHFFFFFYLGAHFITFF